MGTLSNTAVRIEALTAQVGVTKARGISIRCKGFDFYKIGISKISIEEYGNRGRLAAPLI